MECRQESHLTYIYIHTHIFSLGTVLTIDNIIGLLKKKEGTDD